MRNSNLKVQKRKVETKTENESTKRNDETEIETETINHGIRAMARKTATAMMIRGTYRNAHLVVPIGTRPQVPAKSGSCTCLSQIFSATFTRTMSFSRGVTTTITTTKNLPMVQITTSNSFTCSEILLT